MLFVAAGVQVSQYEEQFVQLFTLAMTQLKEVRYFLRFVGIRKLKPQKYSNCAKPPNTYFSNDVVFTFKTSVSAENINTL